jgi:hypothetical protein
MRDTWFDPYFIDLFNNNILPHFDNGLNEGVFLKREIENQKYERFNTRVKKARDTRKQKIARRVLLARHARERGEARAKDALAGQPISKPTYESVEHIFENRQSGKTRKRRDMFRGGIGIRKELKKSMRTSLTGDNKEKDRIRKQVERELEEKFSILSYPLLEQEDQEQEEQGQEQAQEQPQEEQGQVEEQIPLPYIDMLSQAIAMRSKVRNVFENISNISYKILNEKYNVRSVNKNDRDFQIENAIMLVSRICSGASVQELQVMEQFEEARFFDFDEKAFDISRSILLQLGENCIKNLIHAREIDIFEDTPGSMRTQVMCSENTFKIVTGKTYITTSTLSPNYGLKVKKDISAILSQNPEAFIGSDQLLMDIFTAFAEEEEHIPEKGTLDFINKELDEIMNALIRDKITFSKEFEDELKFYMTRHYLYGSNIVDPRANASFLLTDSGLFQLTDEFVKYLSKNASITIKPKKAFKSLTGRRESGSTLPKAMEKYRAIVEQVKENMEVKEPSKEEVLTSLPATMLSSIVDYFDIEFSVSISPKEKITNKQRKSNQFNTVVVKGKEVKIPVTMDKGDMLTNTIKEDIDLACDILVERNMMSKFVANGVKGTKNKSDIPEELKMLIATVISDMKCGRRQSIVEKLEGHEKHYSKKTSHHRSNRNKARRAAEKKYGKAAIKGKDVDHKDGNPMNNSPSNLRLRNPGDNRADNGHHKGEPYKKAKRGITNTYKGKDK